MDKVAFQKLTDEMMAFYTEGKYADALHLVELNADRFLEETARTTFWRLCLLSMCGRSDDVMSVFQQSLASGLWWAESQFLDSDFNPVRDLPEFKRLVDESNQKCLEARTQVKPDRAILLPDDLTQELPLLIALHGRNGNKDSRLERWDVARQRGWLVLSPQSTQALYVGSYCWDDPAQGMKDILPHVDEVMKTYKVDYQRVILGGFSQGSGMAILTALSRKIPVRGFIGIGTWWESPDALASERTDVRGYFVTGEKDPTLERVREIQNVLRANNVQFAEEVHADIGHEFSSDFGTSFDKAIEFIFNTLDEA